MTRARWSPITWPWWSVLRVSVMLLLGALAAWMFSYWGQGGQEEVSVGAILAAVAAGGFVIKPGREAAYAVGAVLVVACLFLGVRDADGVGYCGSVFDGGEDRSQRSAAPEALLDHCRDVRADRAPIMVALALAGGVCLQLAARRRRPRPRPADDEKNAPVHSH